MTSSTLGKLVSIGSHVPMKPALSLLRLGSAFTPVGAAVLGATVATGVVIKAVEHKDEIKSTLGKIVSGVKEAPEKAITTITKIDEKRVLPTDDSPSMLVPILLVGSGLIVLFIVMRK